MIENPTRDELKALEGQTVVLLAGSLVYHGVIIRVSQKNVLMEVGNLREDYEIGVDRVTKVTPRKVAS